MRVYFLKILDLKFKQDVTEVKKPSNLSQGVCQDRLGLEEAEEDIRLRLPEGEFDYVRHNLISVKPSSSSS